MNGDPIGGFASAPPVNDIKSQDHSGRMDSKTIHSTIDTPPGVPGVSKNQNFFFTNKSVELLR